MMKRRVACIGAAIVAALVIGTGVSAEQSKPATITAEDAGWQQPGTRLAAVATTMTTQRSDDDAGWQ